MYIAAHARSHNPAACRYTSTAQVHGSPFKYCYQLRIANNDDLPWTIGCFIERFGVMTTLFDETLSLNRPVLLFCVNSDDATKMVKVALSIEPRHHTLVLPNTIFAYFKTSSSQCRRGESLVGPPLACERI